MKLTKDYTNAQKNINLFKLMYNHCNTGIDYNINTNLKVLYLNTKRLFKEVLYYV